MAIINIPGRYLYPSIWPGMAKARILSINPYGTGRTDSCDDYHREIAWGNAYDMSSIPWGDWYQAIFTDTSGSPTSYIANSASGFALGEINAASCNHPWYDPRGLGGMFRTDFLVYGPTAPMGILTYTYEDQSLVEGSHCAGGSACGWASHNITDGWAVAMEGCFGHIPVSCAGSASGPCNSQIISFPMDAQTAQPCGGTGNAGLVRWFCLPAHYAGDGVDLPTLLTDMAGQCIDAIASAWEGPGSVPALFGAGWDASTVCTATGETYDDPP